MDDCHAAPAGEQYRVAWGSPITAAQGESSLCVPKTLSELMP
jgi:hypothetical protein